MLIINVMNKTIQKVSYCHVRGHLLCDERSSFDLPCLNLPPMMC